MKHALLLGVCLAAAALPQTSMAEKPVAPAAPEQSFQFIDVPDVGRIGPIRLPGELMTATLDSGQEVPYWTQAQAARIAAELAVRDMIFAPDQNGIPKNRIIELFTTKRMEGELPLDTGSSADKTNFCLVASSVGGPVHLKLPGPERQATRSDGVRVQLFTAEQAKVMYPVLREEGLTIPEIAAVFAGFEIAPPQTDTADGTVIFADCGTCADGRLCNDPEEGCCEEGSLPCRTCTLCSSSLKMVLYP